ncbi:twin-arginine translocase subunit TatC [Nocardioides mangrovi]|uniref:Sec-independent protein translocase protein TatC n=1 Tax=Nocardioides mangrovi TaxID=2874580 RepID=A0ABS7UC93_9ACTN|nr:twin-arginine translocase subunit TatC [Nocardioides mangrovi]MBZ5738619.1 twin-arginine translocase subunit TatC [Nocardioides mangrovi]
MTTATVARGTMPLADHLREARRRGVRAAVALAVGVVAGYLLSDQVLDVLRAPIEQLAESRNASLNYDTVTGAFDLKLKIAIFAGVVLSSPIWLLELFAFVTPGLTQRERKYTYGFVLSAVPLFAAGCTFGFLLFPHMVRVLTGFSSDQDSTILTASYYVDFVLKLVLAIGIAFVLPVFLVALNLLGLLPAATLRRSWRVIVVVIVLFSALVTPAADVLSMFFVAAPMTALFGAAVTIAAVHDRRAERRALTTP